MSKVESEGSSWYARVNASMAFEYSFAEKWVLPWVLSSCACCLSASVGSAGVDAVVAPLI